MDFEKIKKNDIRQQLILYISKCFRQGTIIDLRDPIQKNEISKERALECSNQQEQFCINLIKNWAQMIMTTPTHLLSKENRQSKQYFISQGLTLNDLLKDPYMMSRSMYDILEKEKEFLPWWKEPNGKFIFTQHLSNIDRKQGNRTTRIYVSLAPENLCPFLVELMNEAGNEQYYFKFFSNTEADRVVIYPQDQALFKLWDCIEKIYNKKRELFEGCDRKYFTTAVVPGISIASDLGRSFTSATEDIIEKYISTNLPTIDFSKYPKSSLIMNLQIAGIKGEISDSYLDRVTNRFETLPLFRKLAICKRFLNNEEIYKVMSKIYNIDNFNNFVRNYKHHIYSTPSTNNICFTDEEIKHLEEVYEKYKDTQPGSE